MPIWYSPWQYTVGLLVWISLLGFLIRRLLRWRRTRRKAGRSLSLVHSALGAAMLVLTLTACEVAFALFVDQSDAFNMTNVSQRWFVRHIESQRNAFGARDIAEFPLREPQGSKRIVFFGDSFTIGHGVRRRKDRFSDRVADGLEIRERGRLFVANLADPGLEISQIAARIQGVFEAGYQMDRVIYVICLNDIEGYDPETTKAISSLQQKQPENFLISKTYFLNWLYFRLVQVQNRGAKDYFPHLVRSYEGRPWDGFRSKLLKIRDECRRHGAEFDVVVFPFLTELGPNYPFHNAHLRIAEFCEQNGIRCLDLEPELTKLAGTPLTVNAFDAHPNETAHAVAARAILHGLFGVEDGQHDR